MKKIFLILSLAFSAGAFAQSTMQDDIDIVQSVYGKSKKELVAAYMTLTEAQAPAFWKLYDEYEVKRKALGQAKIKIIDDYATNLATLTEKQADELAKAGLKNNMEYQRLFSDYYEKTKRAVGAINAAQFIQLEIYLQTTIQNELQDAIPFIGQIDKTKKPQAQ